MNSFASGGFIPPAQRGTKYTGIVAAWDWCACAAVLHAPLLLPLSPHARIPLPLVLWASVDASVAWSADATFCALAGVDATDHRAAAAQLPPVDSISMVPVLLGTPGARPRLSLPIGAEPRLSNLSTAPPCSSLTQPQVYDGSLEAGQGLPEARQGNCSSVVGLIVDEGVDGLWKLITGDENQVRTSKQLFI